MTEVSEAQGIVEVRKSQMNPSPDAETPPNQNPVAPPTEGNWISRLFKRKNQTPPTLTQDKQVGEVAIDRQGNAVHGIGSEVTEEELSSLEGKPPAQTSETGESTTIPVSHFEQKSKEKLLDNYPNTDTPEDGHPFDPNGETSSVDVIATGDKIENPEYVPGTASNVTPIHENMNVPPTPKKTGW